MELDKTPTEMLAIRLVGITANSIEQQAYLPLTAFARITVWSHGQITIDTSPVSEWASAKPVFLPIGAAGAATELEVALWDKRDTGNTGEASAAALLDVGAEATFPAPNELGGSEQEAVEKTFPLKAQSRGVGTITLRAWRDTSGHASKELAKDLARSSRTASIDDAGSDPGSQMTISGGDTDERLFFELSASSGSNGDTSVADQKHSGGEKYATPTSTQAFEKDGGHLEEQQPVVPHLRRERPSTERDSAEPRHIFEPVTQGPETRFTLTTPTNKRRVSPQSAGDPDGSYLPDRGASPPSFSGAHHAGDQPVANDAATANARTQPQSLNLAAAMLPLIPSFPEGSAEVRVRIRGIRIPCSCHSWATPPYVRASLHPGAHSITRTDLPFVDPGSTNKTSRSSSREAGIPMGEHLTAQRVVEYVFGGEDSGANDGEHMISLPLGPRVMNMALGEDAGSSPPRIRLEVVSGRSLGWCDLALPEALRHPGRVVRKLRVPLCRKRWDHGQAKKHGGRSMSPGVYCCAPGHLASQQQGTFVGEIFLDLGVTLPGEPWPSPSETDCGALELTTVNIHVEAADVRVRDPERGGTGDIGDLALVAEQRTKLIGVSSKLTLGGGEAELSTFHAESHRSRRAEESKPGYVYNDSPSHNGKVAHMSTCAELDILTLTLFQREVDNRSHFLGEEPRHGRGAAPLMIAVSEINDVFDGSWHWVEMRHGLLGEPFNRQKGIHLVGGKAGVHGRGDGGVECRLEVLLRLSVADIIHPHGHHHNVSMGGRSSAKDLMPRHKWNCLGDPSPQEKLKAVEPPPSGGGTPHAALEAWITSPGIGCAQAVAVIPSQGNSSSGSATAHATCGTTLNEKAGNTASYPIQAGPGVFEVEVLAIHGRGQHPWAPNDRDRNSNNGGRDNALGAGFPPSWWVRITCSKRGGGAGGTNDVSSTESPPGNLTVVERSQAYGGRAGTTVTPTSNEHDARRGLGLDWTVRWSPRGGVLTKYPVHWAPSQNSLPVVSFEIFQGQTLTARSTLELPPIIKHQDEHLALLHPCLRICPPEAESFGASSSKSLDTNILLDLRCSFHPDDGERKRQHLEVGKTLAAAPEMPRSTSKTKRSHGGILCMQVVTIQRLHRSVRSALARPSSVVFSLPQHHTHNTHLTHHMESSSEGWIGPSYGGGPRNGWESRPEDSNHQRGSQRCWGDGEGDVAFLRVEPRKHRNMAVLVALLGGNRSEPRARALDSLGQRDSGTVIASQRVLGVTWLPISDNVLQRGHLEDGWFPLRVVGRGCNNASKACDIRLRFHFVPALQHPAASLSFEGLSTRSTTKIDNPDAEFITVILEEGRHLSHPDLLVGPFELFAEIAVDFHPGEARENRALHGTGSRRINCTAVCSQRLVGPLPLREGPPPHEGHSSHAAARRLGKGASPCWQHVVRIPLPAATTLVESTWGTGDVYNDATPRRNPEVTVRSRDENYPPRAMLSVAIKSAAVRVVTRYPSPVPRRLLTSCSGGHVERPEERISERCLLLGVARIRLPPAMFLREPGQMDGAPIRGWYTVQDESSGSHRGKVRLSIFPVSFSTGWARNADTSHANDGASNRPSSTGTDSKGRRYSSSFKDPRSAGSNLRRPRASGNTGGHLSDSSKQSTETDEAVGALRRAGGHEMPEGLRGAGLLFVSISDLVVESFGKEMRQPPPVLVEACVSLRSRKQNPRPREGRPHYLTATRTDGHNPFGGRDSGCTQELGCREYSAVVAVDRCSGAEDYPALYVQAYITTRPPHRPVGTTFHGVVPLTSCLSSPGVAVQESKGLMKVERQTLSQGKIGHVVVDIDQGACWGNDDDTVSAETPLISSGSDEGSGDAEGPVWARGKTEKTGGCCSVTVTTSFVPHVRGTLEVDPIQLSLTPPSHSDLERWRDLTDLRGRTEPECVGESTQTGSAQGLAANDFGRDGVRAATATTTAFLRFRILPAGPWKFSRTFPLKLPRPADWGKDPSSAGTSHLPGEAHAFLELNTALHAIARERVSETSPSVSSPAGRGVESRQGYGVRAEVEVEPPTLEVCLFDNNRRPSSPLPPHSSLALLGVGTVALIPIITSSVRQEERRGESKREVLLYEPGSGKRVASALLGIAFSSDHIRHADDSPPATISPRIAHTTYTYNERLHEILEASEAIWALKAIFYDIDHVTAGFVPVEDILTALSGARWPPGTSTSDLPHLHQITGNQMIPAHANQESETLLNRLSRLGVGTRNSGGVCDDADAQGDRAGLVRDILHLLAPPDSKGDGQLVSWEVWAALSELIVCRCNTALAPPVTAAGVWRRAEEIRRAENAAAVDPAGDDASNEGFPHSQCAGELASRSAADVGGGYGDISFWADEDGSREKLLPRECPKMVEKGRGNSDSRKPAHQTLQTSLGVRGRPNSAPQMTNGSKGRLQHTLATSRRSWSLRSRSQRQLRRGQGRTRDNIRGLGRSSSTPSRRHGMARPPGTFPNEPHGTPHFHRVSERNSAERLLATPNLRKRPMTAPVGEVPTGTTEPAHPAISTRTVPARQRSRQSAHGNTTTCGVGDGLRLDLRNSTAFVSKMPVGAWDEGPVTDVGHAGGECERRGDWTTHGDTESIHLRAESASAKRKAAQYQTCMLEAQRALGKEHQRVVALEERALEVEGLLLQRNRMRIREEARARTRFMQLQVEIARRNERVASRNNKARVEAAAATRVQRVAKGYLERCRFKAEILRIKALQHGGRSMLQARRRHHFRARQMLAAVLLQKTWRGRSARQRLAVRNVRVALVQAVVRGHLQRARISDELQVYLRCRNEAAAVLQKNRRRTVGRRSFLSLRRASVRVQSNHRRWRARRRLKQRRLSVRVIQRAGRNFVFYRLRTKAAVVLQKSYRLRIRIKICRSQRKAILDAAGIIQQVVRAWVARRVVSRRREKRRMDHAAATLQHAMWEHLCRRKEHRRRVTAALTLLKFMGGLSVKLSQMRKRRTSSAATRIQSAFRVRRSRLRLSALRARRRGIVAALKIQAVTRGHSSRVKARAMLAERRKQSAACTKIQAASRGYMSRVKTRILMVQRLEGLAATRIQALFRGRRSRVKVRELRAKRRAAATTIQSLLLRNRRERIHACRCERERSALIIQRAWRKSKTSGYARLPHKISTALRMDDTQRGSVSAASSKPRRASDHTTLDHTASDRTTLQLALEALAAGVASCSVGTPRDVRRVHEELALREDDPDLKASLTQRLSDLEAALASSGKLGDLEDKPKKVEVLEGRNGQKALLQSLRVLEKGLLRPSE